MTVTVYRHNDASAPSLTGQVGSLSALLLACLVNGYGSKIAAGWTNPYNGTNQAVFRPGTGVQHYFAINDNAPVAANYAELQGFETMTAWATGTGPFPVTAGTSCAILKSSTADTTARPWVVIADDRSCYFFADFSHTPTQYSGGTVPTYSGIGFGEFYSLMTTTDSYRSFVMGRVSESATTATSNDFMASLQNLVSQTLGGHYTPRNYTGIGSAVASGKWGDMTRGGMNVGGTGYNAMGVAGLAVPDTVTGAIHLVPIHWSDSSGLRGRMRGFFQLCHAHTSFADGDIITGSGAYAGRSFMMVKGVQTGIVTAGGSFSNQTGACVFDITGAWETN